MTSETANSSAAAMRWPLWIRERRRCVQAGPRTIWGSTCGVSNTSPWLGLAWSYPRSPRSRDGALSWSVAGGLTGISSTSFARGRVRSPACRWIAGRTTATHLASTTSTPRMWPALTVSSNRLLMVSWRKRSGCGPAPPLGSCAGGFRRVWSWSTPTVAGPRPVVAVTRSSSAARPLNSSAGSTGDGRWRR